MRLSRLVIGVSAILVLASCKIRIIVPDDGSVATSSGAYSCAAGETCNIDVVDFFFDQTFVAKPAAGYKFKFWRKGDRRFCGGSPRACHLFTTSFTGEWIPAILDWLESEEVFYLQPVFEFACNAKTTPLTITGSVAGDPLSITVSDRFAGAVESLKWRGKEFINIWDHGRQLQYAWRMDDFSECLNPTEAGSSLDYQAATSTSELLSACKTNPSTLTTTARLAYWLAPGEAGFCSGGASYAVNEVLVSDQILRKTITIGYNALENVIAFDAMISNPTNYSIMDASIPIGYLTHEFTRALNFNPQTGVSTVPTNQTLLLEEPWLQGFNFFASSKIPPILATPNGDYAMAAYYAGPKLIDYQLSSTDSSIRADQTNIWMINIQEAPYPAGVYRYQSFVIVGTLEQVKTAMTALYKLHPTDFSLPEGSLDVVSCNQIAGWSWDPGEPNRPLKVAIYDVSAQGKESLITTVTAGTYRVDLKNALKGNGVHGFDIPTPAKLRDGRPHTIRAYGINPDPKLPSGVLYPSGITLQCS